MTSRKFADVDLLLQLANGNLRLIYGKSNVNRFQISEVDYYWCKSALLVQVSTKGEYINSSPKGLEYYIEALK